MGSREIPTTDFLCKAVNIFGPKWFSEEIRKLMKGRDTIDGHESLPWKSDGVPVLLVDVLGFWTNVRLSGNYDCAGVVFVDCAM